MKAVGRSISCLSAISVVAALAATAAASAQSASPPPAEKSSPPAAAVQSTGPGWGPGFMMGPGMMHGAGMWGYGGPCNPRAAGMAEWRIDQIEHVVQPTEAQRAALTALRDASTKAADELKSACPREIQQTSVQRLAFMEQRMEAMLAAIKTVRPAFDAFYATLSNEQKARLDSVGPRRWGWHWRWWY